MDCYLYTQMFVLLVKQDSKNIELNETYLPYGVQGKKGWARQQKEDQNAQRNRSSYISRSLSKSSRYYSNSTWDLVDAAQEKGFDWDNVDEDSLPPALLNKTRAEQKEILRSYQQKRALLQKEMQDLKKLRQQYLYERTSDTQKTLGAALIKVLSQQAQQKSFTL